MRRLVIYKLELICVKYVPIIIALLSLLDNVLMYYDISLDILSYIAGTSILTTIPMYISSYVYKFCKYHRMFIHYIVVNKVIAMVDNYIIIPLIVRVIRNCGIISRKTNYKGQVILPFIFFYLS